MHQGDTWSDLDMACLSWLGCNKLVSLQGMSQPLLASLSLHVCMVIVDSLTGTCVVLETFDYEARVSCANSSCLVVTANMHRHTTRSSSSLWVHL